MPRKAIEYHSSARAEARAAAKWYADRDPNVSRRFVAELNGLLRAVSEAPHTFPVYEAGTRRALMRSFPYAIVFLDERDRTYVVAVAHAKRRPGHWQSRA